MPQVTKGRVADLWQVAKVFVENPPVALGRATDTLPDLRPGIGQVEHDSAPYALDSGRPPDHPARFKTSAAGQEFRGLMFHVHLLGTQAQAFTVVPIDCSFQQTEQQHSHPEGRNVLLAPPRNGENPEHPSRHQSAAASLNEPKPESSAGPTFRSDIGSLQQPA